MRPIIRMLLRNGVTYKAFSHLLKRLFVEVAANDYGINGRPTNTTRIAILTGLDRKVIKQLRDEESDEKTKSEESTDRITRVLSGWHTDTDFTDQQQRPLPLSLKGTEPNLRTLLLRYGGDVQPTAMLKELKRVGVVEEIENGKWQATQRNYIYSKATPETLSRGFLGISDVATNLHHNLYIANEKTPKRFERRVSTANLPQDLVPEFRDLVNKEGQQFLEHLDAWLTQHEVDPQSNPDKELARVGLGMYWIEVSEPQEIGSDS